MSRTTGEVWETEQGWKQVEMRIQSGAGWETTGQEGEQAEGNAVGTAAWDRTGMEMKPGSVRIGARKSKEKQEM